MADPTIVLIGPVAVGKSTVGKSLATRLGVPFVDLDEVGPGYYAEAGLPVEHFVEQISFAGLREAHRRWQPARVHAAFQCVAQHPGAVIAFGAGHSHFEDVEHFEHVRSALADATVALLLPTTDIESSEAFLRARCADRGADWSGLGFIREWLTSEQNQRLADVVVYVADRTHDEIAAQITLDQAGWPRR